MSALFLTMAEVVELTGRRQSASQCRHLQAVKIPFRCDADGRPKIIRAELGAPTTEVMSHASPNRAALTLMIGKGKKYAAT